jgi:hypothetical protein
MKDLIYIPEPRLLFRHGQAMEDPRDGLTLFGPLDESKPYGIKAGVIGTETGIKCFERLGGMGAAPSVQRNTAARPSAVSRL